MTACSLPTLDSLPAFGGMVPARAVQWAQGSASSPVLTQAQNHLQTSEDDTSIIGVEDYQRFSARVYPTIAPHGPPQAVAMPQGPAAAKGAGDACPGTRKSEACGPQPTPFRNRETDDAYDGAEWLHFWKWGDDRHAVAPLSIVMDGFIGVCLDFYRQMDRGQWFAGPVMALWSHNLFAGGECGYYDERAHAGTRWNTTGNFSARNTVNVGGRLPKSPGFASEKVLEAPGSGETFEHRAIRRHLGICSQDEAMRVNTVHSRQWGWVSVAGLNLFGWMRFLYRRDYTSSSNTNYATWVDAASARLLSMDGCNFFMQWLSNTWRAIWHIDRLAVPDIAHPECLAPGDELTQLVGERRGRLRALGLSYLFGGLQNADVSETTLRLERPTVSSKNALSGNEGIRLCVKSRQQASRRWSGSVPGGLGGDTGGHHFQETVFSLSVPDDPVAMAYYRTFLAQLKGASTLEHKRNAVSQLADTLHVQFTEEKAEGAVQSYETGVRVGLLPSNLWARWMPEGFSWGLANSVRHSHIVHTHKNDRLEQDWLTDSCSLEKRDLRGPDGERHQVAMAVIQRYRDPNGKSSGGVLLCNHVRLSRADHSEVYRDIIYPIGTAYKDPLVQGPLVKGEGLSAAGSSPGTAAAALLGAGWRVGRQARFEQHIGVAQLRALLHLNTQARRAAARAAGSAPESLDQFLNAVAASVEKSAPAHRTRTTGTHCVADADLLDAFAAHFEGYLRAAGGMTGPAAVYQALLHSAREKQTALPRVYVRSTCDAYTRPGAQVDALQRHYHDAGVEQLPAMRSAVRKAQDEIAAIEEWLLSYDALSSPAQKKAHKAEFARQKAQLTDLYFQAPRVPLPASIAEWRLAGQNFLRSVEAQGSTRSLPTGAANAPSPVLATLLRQGKAFEAAQDKNLAALQQRLEACLPVTAGVPPKIPQRCVCKPSLKAWEKFT